MELQIEADTFISPTLALTVYFLAHHPMPARFTRQHTRSSITDSLSATRLLRYYRILGSVIAASVFSVLPSRAVSQTTLTVDANVASAFVWRAIHFTNRPVVQADVFLTQSARNLTFTGGAWFNVEPVDYQGTGALHMLTSGNSGPALTAITTWLDGSVSLGGLDATLGITSYQYPKRTGFAEGFNTTELYAGAGHSGLLSPHVQVWWDIGKIRGAYVETTISHSFQAALPISTSLTAGWSAGQEEEAAESSYFGKAGFAALDASLGTSYTLGSLTISPAIHGVLAHDPATQVVTLGGAAERTKIWWTVGASWTR